jgi:nitrogen fixation protein FixH
MSALAMKQLTGRHVLFILLGFFGVVATVNAYFVYAAVSTFTGVETNSYGKGLRYNEVLAAAKTQAELRWSHKVEMTSAGTVQVSVKDKDGAPVAGLNFLGQIGRPAADRYSHELSFTETKPGVYTASSGIQEAGRWVVAVAATRPHAQSEPPVYRLKERLWLEPKQQ